MTTATLTAKQRDYLDRCVAMLKRPGFTEREYTSFRADIRKVREGKCLYCHADTRRNSPDGLICGECHYAR